MIEQRANKLLGTSTVNTIVPEPVYVPTWKQLSGLIDECDKENDLARRKVISERKDLAKKLNKWDWEKNYGRKAFAASRNNYVPPTTHLADPDNKGSYITATEEIHNQFRETWGEIYCKHPKRSTHWGRFEAK